MENLFQYWWTKLSVVLTVRWSWVQPSVCRMGIWRDLQWFSLLPFKIFPILYSRLSHNFTIYSLGCISWGRYDTTLLCLKCGIVCSLPPQCPELVLQLHRTETERFGWCNILSAMSYVITTYKYRNNEQYHAGFFPLQLNITNTHTSLHESVILGKQEEFCSHSRNVGLLNQIPWLGKAQRIRKLKTAAF
jgi:hypothetical protein